MLGRFLELSVPTARILESWQFYQRLGFTSATAGEVWPHRYAVVTDGRVSLGLHEGGIEGPCITYVRHDLARHLAALEDSGVPVATRTLGEDQFNQIGFEAPDRHAVRLIEARTFSPSGPPAATRLGWFAELALPSKDLDRARSFWEALGFVTTAERTAPWPQLALTSDTLSLGLHAAEALGTPTLIFESEDVGSLRAALEAAGVAPERSLPRALDPGEHLLLVAPEGTRILVGPPSEDG